MNTQIEQIQRACDIIRANPEERHTLGALAGQVGLSRFHFQRAFTQVVGISPRAYAEACRLGHVKTALKNGEPVTTAIYDAGYGSSSRLYERAGAALGMTPATYRKGAPGVEIDFTIAESPLGRLLLAATEPWRVSRDDRRQRRRSRARSSRRSIRTRSSGETIGCSARRYGR